MMFTADASAGQQRKVVQGVKRRVISSEDWQGTGNAVNVFGLTNQENGENREMDEGG